MIFIYIYSVTHIVQFNIGIIVTEYSIIINILIFMKNVK